MAQITRHCKERIVERTDGVNNFAEAKKLAKRARIAGKTISDFQSYPAFADYLRSKRDQTNSCAVRVYKGNVYVWRGKNKLLTAHPIPDRFLDELEGAVM